MLDRMDGEVAETFFFGQYPYICSHEIPAHARSCACGLRVAVVAGPWQLALFSWPRDTTHYRYTRELPPPAIDGVIT